MLIESSEGQMSVMAACDGYVHCCPEQGLGHKNLTEVVDMAKERCHQRNSRHTVPRSHEIFMFACLQTSNNAVMSKFGVLIVLVDDICSRYC